MDEKVLPIILLDEAIALFLVEPFHLSFSHRDIPPFCLLLLGISPDIALANKKGHRELCDTPHGHLICFPKLPSDSSKPILYWPLKPVNKNFRFISKFFEGFIIQLAYIAPEIEEIYTMYLPGTGRIASRPGGIAKKGSGPSMGYAGSAWEFCGKSKDRSFHLCRPVFPAKVPRR
jgi:hypothetical protein